MAPLRRFLFRRRLLFRRRRCRFRLDAPEVKDRDVGTRISVGPHRMEAALLERVCFLLEHIGSAREDSPFEPALEVQTRSDSVGVVFLFKIDLLEALLLTLRFELVKDVPATDQSEHALEYVQVFVCNGTGSY